VVKPIFNQVFFVAVRNTPAYILMMATPQIRDSTSETFAEVTQPYRPILDGTEFTQPPLQFFQSTAWNTDKKIFIGFTSQEHSTNIKSRTPIVSRDLFFVSNTFKLY